MKKKKKIINFHCHIILIVAEILILDDQGKQIEIGTSGCTWGWCGPVQWKRVRDKLPITSLGSSTPSANWRLEQESGGYG
jgi:hypothetical protein